MKKYLKFWDIALVVIFLIMALALPYPSVLQAVFGVLTILALAFVALKRWVKLW